MMSDNQTNGNPAVQMKDNALYKLYRYFICPSCAYFSLTSILITLFYYIISGDSAQALAADTMLFIWLFSMAMAALNFVFRIDAIPKPLRLVLHWLGFLVLFIIVQCIKGISSGTVIFTVLLSVLYFIIAGLCALLIRILKPIIIERFLLSFCVYFTCAMFISIALCYAIEVADGAPTLLNQCRFWIFAAAMTLLENIYRTKISMFFRVLLHYLGFIVATIVVFFVLAHCYVDFTDAFLATVVISISYFFVTAVVLLITSAFKSSENKEQKYRQQFNR